MGTVPVKKVSKRQNEGWIYAVQWEKVSKKQDEGWFYVVQWENDPYAVKMGFAPCLKEPFSLLFPACRHRLLVLKAFTTDASDSQRLHERFNGCRDSGGWLLLTPGLQHFIKHDMPCHTKKAQAIVGPWMEDRLKWCPMVASKRELLEAAHKADDMPDFVVNARTYVLWALRDIKSHGFYATSNNVIHHPSNKGFYEAQTIYNCLAGIIAEGFAVKDTDKCYHLTALGEQMLVEAEGQKENKQPHRKSAFSTRLGRGMA